MPKFRKKPVVIEATQWFPPGDSQYVEGVHNIVPFPRGPRVVGQIYSYSSRYYIYTLEGDMLLSPGDWIITGVKGEQYPCKPDIFAETYEAVE